MDRRADGRRQRRTAQEEIAAAIAEEIGREVDYAAVDPAGAARAAASIAALVAWRYDRGCQAPRSAFTEETARKKVQAAEDAWNTCDPERVALAYTVDSDWRNRDEFFQGREAIVEFLRRKWAASTTTG